MVNRVHNFNAGPAALPLPALERAQAEMLDFAGTSMSVMEHSHRGKEYEAAHHEALGLVGELVGLPASHQVVFLQGGAHQLFSLVPMNFLRPGQRADYLVTGTWGEKAIEEAVVLGQAREAATTRVDKTYRRALRQDEITGTSDAAYVHYTTNETIHGVQFKSVPEVGGAPLVADMSSDILSGPLDVSRFDLIYAGAQKNIGPSGLVVVIARKSFLEGARTDITKYFRIATHAAADSLYNTAPTFSIYMVRNVLAWLKEQGGLPAMAARNGAKAATLYGALDEAPEFYRAPVERDSRSTMNVVFRLPTPELEEKLLAAAARQHMVGLKGHRSVGGLRASLYNAVEPSSVDALAQLLRDFRRENG